MPILVTHPSYVQAAGNKPKVIEEFVGRIRDTLRFDSVEALLERMDADVAATREVLDGA